MKRNVKLFINDIESFVSNISKKEFFNNKEKQNAVVRSLEIIGETVKNLPNSFREKYPNVPRRDIAGFRDVMIHGHFSVDLDKVWNIIQKDLFGLKKEILIIDGELGEE